MANGHMTSHELDAMHGDTMQLVPVEEQERDPQIVQARPVGKHHAVKIGSGWHGLNIRLSFYQPQRSETVSAIDTATGESIFAGARKTERTSRGHIHAQDFPTRDKKAVARETDLASVAGIHLFHLKKTQRAHWQNIESRGIEKRPRRTKMKEDDVPWETPNQLIPSALHFTRYK